MVWVACVVCGWCCVLVVFCMACSSHHFVHTKPPPLSPFPSPFTTPLFCLSVCGKVGGPESGWCGMECGVWHATHQPLCFHQAITNPRVSGPSPFPSHSQTPSLLPSLFGCLVVLFVLDRKSEGQVWDSPCQTHCAPHPIHATLFPSNHTHPFQ